MVLLGSHVESLRLRRWMEACRPGLRNFQYPRAGILELSCTLLVRRCSLKCLQNSGRVRSKGIWTWVSWMLEMGDTWDETWDPVGTSSAGVGGGHFLTCPEFTAVLLIERIMNEQHWDPSCEGTCRCLSPAARTYFDCNVKRLDVVCELVLDTAEHKE